MYRYDQREYDDAESYVQSWIAVSTISFSLNFLNLFIGYSVFQSKTINLVQIVLHALAGMRIAMFSIYEYDFRIVWQIFVVHNLPSLLLDIWLLIAIFVLKKKRY